MSRNAWVVAAVVLLLVAGGWYLMRSKTSTTAPVTAIPTEAPVATEVASPTSTEGAAIKSVVEITVSGGEFSFTPNKLTVRNGEKVRLVFKNDGKFPHNLIIDELNVATKTINAGQTDTVEFTVSKTGTFTMYCSVDSHRQKGMEATLSVL